ncbi:hypothetical protein NC653_031403 [Populus alba x Populus x berolinensis]|uniref:SAC domain-containing protein n=1 Tax=Populus alba x Populus x berolinensis TaxID=444605 RepID=A0AAD6Q1B8_9ROSI|nr:hypothetical protein NC653_031403 [Populus alba x Populus x berolinensis]
MNRLIHTPTAKFRRFRRHHQHATSTTDPNPLQILWRYQILDPDSEIRFYLVGSDRRRKLFRVLKIDRSEPSDLNISEDLVVYSPQEINNLLQRIAEGNRATGGLNFVAKAYGIACCIKFLESYYLILVTKRRQIGFICGHVIYGIDESQLITIPHVSVQTDLAHSKAEIRYKKLLSSVDLTKDFFFSYTYPVMQSLQKNVMSIGEDRMPYDNIFRVECISKHELFGLDVIRLSNLWERLQCFTGFQTLSTFCRYLKRGLMIMGRVANDVETEQIVLDEDAGCCKGKMSSVVQMRGSIPLFWKQEASQLSPKT